jgi:hypothetical protein
MRNLVHQRERQITFRGGLRRLLRLHQLARDRQDHVRHARVHEVLEEDLLRALLLMDARIVRQIVGHRLIAVPQIARAIRRVHHFHRRQMAALRRTRGRIHRQRVLNIRHILLIDRQLLALFLIANQDRRAERRLHAQQIVEVGFIRREDHVELRILQIQPRQVALVIVVAEQRIGAQPQKIREGGIGAEPRRIAQRLRHRDEQRLVFLAV